MFCIYCGSALPSDAIFCNSCGKRQNLTTPSISTNTIRPEAVLPEQPASSVEIVADNLPLVQERAAQTDMFSADQQTPPLLSSFLVNGTRLTAAPLPTTRQSFGPILAGAG